MMKGIIFNLDALIAVILTGVILFSISNFQATPEANLQSNLYLSKIANDVLVVMDKSGAFNSLNNNTIYSNLSSLLPNTVAGKLTIETFELSGSNFQKVNETTVSHPPNAVPKQIITARTIFLIFESNRIRYYNTAKLEVWQR